jgi:hypothetical protein
MSANCKATETQKNTVTMKGEDVDQDNTHKSNCKAERWKP